MACALGAHITSPVNWLAFRSSSTYSNVELLPHPVRTVARPRFADTDAVYVHTTGWTPVCGSQHSSTQPRPPDRPAGPGSWILMRSRLPDLLVCGSRMVTRTPKSDRLDPGSQTPEHSNTTGWPPVPQTPQLHDRLDPGPWSSLTPVRQRYRQEHRLDPGAWNFLDGTSMLVDTTDSSGSNANTCLGRLQRTRSVIVHSRR